jgi:peptidoglycan/LPS O-acetylase OafA/YrhL
MFRSADAKNAGHLDFLDALRGIAILGVLLVHAMILTRQEGHSFKLAFTGQRGVELFYMISAFTLCLSLDAKREERYPLLNYFIRRFFRIAPLFYLVIIVNLILKHVSAPYSSQRNLGALDIVLGFLFLNGARPHAMTNVVDGGWSIAVETTFYLLLPLLFKYLNSVRRLIVVFAIAAPALKFICFQLASRSMNGFVAEYFTLFWFPVQFPIFALGMLTYFIWKRYINGHVFLSEGRQDISLSLLLGSAIVYWACLPFGNLNLYVSSFLFVPLILGLSVSGWKVFVNRFTRFLGKISYSLYLLHFFLLLLTDAFLHRLDQVSGHPISKHVYGHSAGMLLVFVFLICVSVPFCYLSWRFIETPGINLGKKLITNLEGTRAQ